MTRPPIDEYFMEIALQVATRSTCIRRKVGAVLVQDRHIISTGYNDTPRGAPNCGDGGCRRCSNKDVQSGEALDACVCVHAEQNAIALAAYHGTRTAGATIYSETLPCLACAKIIVNAGIARVVYINEYPTPWTFELFNRSRVDLARLERDT